MTDSNGTDSRTLDDVASRALAAIILEQTAIAINDGGSSAAKALGDLEGNTGLSLDVCAGILYAVTSLTALGGLDSEAVFAASLTYEPDDDESLEQDEQ